MNIRAIIVQVKETLSLPTSWTQGAFARAHSEGSSRMSHDPEATCWCLDGAVSKVCDKNFAAYHKVIDLLAETIKKIDPLIDDFIDDFPQRHVRVWNDDEKRTHQDVINLLDRVLQEVS